MTTPAGGIWAFDFDGTLSHLVPDRHAATLDLECESLLKDLAGDLDQIVAVVSSRSLEDLRSRVKLDKVILAGGSGLEWWLPGGEGLSPNRQSSERLHMERWRVFPALEEVQRIPGVEIEDKHWSAAVHFRNVTPEDRASVAREIENLRIHYGLSLHYGPDVAEIQFLQEISKEIALKTLVKLFSHRPAVRNLFYAGDDQNDAQAMRWVLDRDGIVYIVGDRISVTGANVVTDPTDLARALRRRFGWIGKEWNHQDESVIDG